MRGEARFSRIVQSPFAWFVAHCEQNRACSSPLRVIKRACRKKETALATQDAKLADINIISEKSAYEGLTRFEDRERLPLGTNFNITAYGASLLLQAAVDPKVRSQLLSCCRSGVCTVPSSPWRGESLLCAIFLVEAKCQQIVAGQLSLPLHF